MMGKTALFAVGGGGSSGAAIVAALAGSSLGVVLVYTAPLPILLVGLGLAPAPSALPRRRDWRSRSRWAASPAPALRRHARHPVLADRAAGVAAERIQPRRLADDRPDRGGRADPTGCFRHGHHSLGRRGDQGIEGGSPIAGAVAGMAAPALGEMERKALADQLAPFFLGFSAIAWLLMMLVNAGMAQSLLAARKWNWRPSPQWSQLRLPGWFDWVLVGAAAALVTSGDASFLARNILMVLLTPYFLVGLAVAHVMAWRTSMPGLALASFYGRWRCFF